MAIGHDSFFFLFYGYKSGQAVNIVSADADTHQTANLLQSDNVSKFLAVLAKFVTSLP